MSPFAKALKELLEDTNSGYTHDDWAEICGFKGDKKNRVRQWLNDEAIPRASDLCMIWCTLEHTSKIKVGPMEAFHAMAELDARDVSPFGKRMLPTVWAYMHRGIFDELSSKLAKLDHLPLERETLLESLFPRQSG